MSVKFIFIHLFRILLLTLILTVGSIIGGIGSGLSNLNAGQTQEESGSTFLILIGVHFVSAILLSFFLMLARWRGWRLVLAVFVIRFGITTFMPQLETFFFGEAMKIDNALLLKIILSGLITSLLFAPLSVLLFGKMKGALEVTSISIQNLHWKLPTLTIIYVLLYFSFGYYIAWQSPAVRLYYTGSTNLLSFADHMVNVFRNDWGLLLFQVFRGLLWVGFVILILHCCKGKRWELAILSGLLLGVLMTIQLFIPNPFMPEAVRMVHFVETASSTFLFGVIAVIVLMFNINKSIIMAY